MIDELRVLCPECGKRSRYVMGKEDRSLSALLERHGWRFSGNLSRYICPECAEEPEE